MGGTISVQIVSLTLLLHEHHLRTHLLPPLFRYRDNYLALLSSHFFINLKIVNNTRLLDHVKRTLSSCIRMNLKLENIGTSVLYLEAQLIIANSSPSPSLKLPCFGHQTGGLVAWYVQPTSLPWVPSYPMPLASVYFFVLMCTH